MAPKHVQASSDRKFSVQQKISRTTPGEQSFINPQRLRYTCICPGKTQAVREDHPRAPVNGCVNIYLYLGDEPISRFLLCRHRRKDAEARAGDDVLVKLAIDAPLDLVRKVLKYV